MLPWERESLLGEVWIVVLGALVVWGFVGSVGFGARECKKDIFNF